MPEISTIQNSHVEIAKYEYPHLKGLWFSDVSKGREEMFIDVLIGARISYGTSRKGAQSGENQMSLLPWKRN